MISNYQYAFTQKAKDDLDDILRYMIVELVNPTAASNFLEHLEKVLEETYALPKSGTPTENAYLPELEIREKLIDHYVMYYLTDAQNEQITVLRLVYSRRNLQEIIKEL